VFGVGISSILLVPKPKKMSVWFAVKNIDPINLCFNTNLMDKNKINLKEKNLNLLAKLFLSQT